MCTPNTLYFFPFNIQTSQYSTISLSPYLLGCLGGYIIYVGICIYNGFGGLGVACWPLVPMFTGSNPAEAVGFLERKKKSSARLLSEGK